MFRKIILSFLIFPSFFPIWSEKPTFQYFGKAYDLNSGKYVYSDNHSEFFTGGKHQRSEVIYKDAAGNPFAKKYIHYDQNPLVPTFSTEDYRDGYLEGADVKGKQVRLYYKRKKEDSLEEKTYLPAYPAVMDGGFDHFVREYWDKLTRGERMSFRFLVPVQLDDYLFAVEKIKDEDRNGRKAIYVKLEIDNFILKRLIKPILLVYDYKTKRILQYEGISNINDENGKSLKVKIVYDYPKEILVD
ncbi:hypothetical protein LPTSP3_g33660 [Leptospira kobayashii]|uniref:MORN repeat protein n=1 Tax=Leptospira kobayashii TaxID=1917830 RepID=A0ABM7UMW4_9LEPT|nr:hypothetical protein [Leptospira kobayashii]BDA80436.1 hypothetical protein LPTSP3_g33660 [Leptospira kobayashii]